MVKVVTMVTDHDVDDENNGGGGGGFGEGDDSE